MYLVPYIKLRGSYIKLRGLRSAVIRPTMAIVIAGVALTAALGCAAGWMAANAEYCTQFNDVHKCAAYDDVVRGFIKVTSILILMMPWLMCLGAIALCVLVVRLFKSHAALASLEMRSRANGRIGGLTAQATASSKHGRASSFGA